MAKRPLTKDSEFTVGEEKILNYILALFFLALFAYGLIDAAKRNFKNIDYQSYVFALAIAPAIYCFRRANSKRVYIRINKNGIFQDGKLITDWSNFLRAWLGQKEKTGIFNIKDNFLLIVEYKKNGKGFRHKIPLTNTQNKSEEDVLAAVNFFWKIYRTDAGR
ncbi:MAG: hypothetical protein HOP10_05335 [Chitinophagaceae bacterium]|nr:hypothetical protein [Chitinophagaceae bacterium]